jgi:hypothetical protein
MNINYSWVITELERESTINGLSDVIIRVRYRYIGTDSETQLTGEFFGATPMPLPSSENFIPYSELTEQNIIDWLLLKANIDHMKEKIEQQITQKMSPPIVDFTLPWNNN